MKVPLLDLKMQYASIKDDVMNVTQELFEKQQFILGESVTMLENEIAHYCQTRYAVGVSSGTDALVISLMAADIGPMDIVITSPYTFFATAGSIARVGAEPVFVDIDPDTYNLSPEAVRTCLEEMSPEDRKRVKAVIPVHLYGQCAQMDDILEIALKNDLMVIEDAAQAIGAEFQSKRAGSMGHFGCFSFFPSKNLGAFGDGGIVTTNKESLYEKLKILRVHGSSPKYYHKYIGGNFRLDAIQAAIVSVKLKHLDKWTQERQDNARIYRKLFKKAGLEKYIQLPLEKENRHIYNQFIIRVIQKRDELKAFLQKSDIGTEIYYPVPLHLQECFSHLNYKMGEMPASEYAAEHTLALPIYPELTRDQIEYVVEKIKAFF